MSTRVRWFVILALVASLFLGVSNALASEEYPDIEVRFEDNGVSIRNGDTTPSLGDGTDFGGVAVSAGSTSHWFRIYNTGDAPLELTGHPPVVISGANASDFTVNTQPDSSTIANYPYYVQVEVVFNPSAKGVRIATISIANNVGGKNPYNFTIQGTGASSNSTLTVRSTGAYDGGIIESTETSEMGGAFNSSLTTFRLGDNSVDKQYRAILSFNTSSLPDNAIITKVTLKIKNQGWVGSDYLGDILVDIIKGAFSGKIALQSSDFQATASKNAVGAIPYRPLSNRWHSNTWWMGEIFNYINLTGVTQFRLHFAHDDNDDLRSDYKLFCSGDCVMKSLRPALIIEYYVP